MPFGRAGDPKKAKRTVRVDMTDQMRFHPAEITVKRGDVVRFVPVEQGHRSCTRWCSARWTS